MRYVIYSKHPENSESKADTLDKVVPVYYKSTTFKSSDWDTYGSQPAMTNRWTINLREAKVFDTRVEAIDLFEKNIEQNVAIPNYIHIVQVTDKQLFKARLAA